MGFRVQLIAVRGKEIDAIHRDYGVAPRGHREETPESPVVGALLPSGAYLLYINDQDRIVPDPDLFSRLSKGATLIDALRRDAQFHGGNTSGSTW